jgi:Fe-S cluster assembly protein SufB
MDKPVTVSDLNLGKYILGWSDVEDYVFKPEKGLSEEVIRGMSRMKNEPDWMLEFRLKAYRKFLAKPMMPWFADKMPGLDFDDIYYYIKPTDHQVDNWEELPESIRNTYEKLGIPEAERKYLAGVTSQYECLRGSTLVWTTRGMCPIKELVSGNEVFSLDEDSKKFVISRIVNRRSSGTKDILEIHARGRTIGVSANHPFLVLRDERQPGRQRRRYQRRWIPAGELKIGDFVAIATDIPEYGYPAALRKPDRSEAVNFPIITSDDFCWWAGLYLGDGYVKHNGKYLSLEIAVNKADKVLIAEIIRVTKALFGIDMKLASDGFRLRGRHTAALVEFIELNGLGGKAHTKQMPDWIFETPRSQRLAMIAGFLDADGYVGNDVKSHDVIFTSVNQQLLSRLRELAHLCGIGSSQVIEVRSRHPIDRERWMIAYHLHLSGRFDQLSARSPHHSERLKMRRYWHSYRTAKGTDLRTHTSEMLGFVRIEFIETASQEPVFDIEVDGHHNFIAEGFVVHNSEVVYHRNREELAKQGVLFSDMDTAVREYPEIVRRWFGKIIPPNDNKFAALNSAAWSGGSFVYVPAGVKVEMPLQAYFRINAENMGQFERTLIIAEEGAQVHYLESCSAPIYSSDSLHAAVVELVALPSSRITYTTIQNWSNNVYNLVTKRARAEAEARVEWIDGNVGCLAMGSRVKTLTGLKPIEDVQPGDLVLSYDTHTHQFQFRAVKAKRFSGNQQVREVRSGQRSVRVTDNHPFLTLTAERNGLRELNGSQFRYVRADQLTEAIVPIASTDFGFLGEMSTRGANLPAPVITGLCRVVVGQPLVPVPTWDIEVEGTGNFVAEGFIVHNSRLTMKYPSVYLMGPRASGEVLSVAYAGAGQIQDTGAKMFHCAPDTTSTIISKSISKDGGSTTYRGKIHVDPGAQRSKSFVRCDALILDEDSVSETKPYMEVGERDAEIAHEATVSKVGDDQLFYLMSRGLSEEQAKSMIVNGFIEPVTRTLPMEYAVEWSRLIELQMEGAVG